MDLYFSFIVPVFNRPNEIRELLDSLIAQTFGKEFEIVIVEDGSTVSSKDIIGQFSDQLNISYYEKPNSGPGDSRNYGMRAAKGNYFIILDSDCILPPEYLSEVKKHLENDFVHCYGGPDAAHPSFTLVQKAINYAMTSYLTTGGIRGKKNSVDKFQPRSFNMGISKFAFEKVGGYGNIHPGEDPDLTIRIWEAGFETKLIPDAFVYHKRRIDWKKFYIQVKKFGMVRPILNKWHPKTAKLTYWFPSLFILGILVSVMLLFWNIWWPILVFAGYFVLLFMDAFLKTRSIPIALTALLAVVIQFFGYGFGFLKSSLYLNFTQRAPESIFPNLFFKKNKQ
ncbi:glycosyltransferase [Maribacter aestuarii]|uniref:glycosyltransferase n=1 Tax=Maribacter aestuarii TaxID=1130723 RepID=UPI0025A67EDF|nr:glycosyltransferase [Maribacter aestuarii]